MKAIGLMCFCLMAGGMAFAAPADDNRQVVCVDVFENKSSADQSNLTALRDRITERIVNTRKFQVVERQNLKSVMKERDLEAAGVTDGEALETNPKLKAAGYVISGAVISFGYDSTATRSGDVAAKKVNAMVELQLRFTDVRTGKLIAMKSVQADGSQSRMSGENVSVRSNLDSQAITDAVRNAAQMVTDELIELAFPTKVLKVGETELAVNLTKEQTEEERLYDLFEMGEELTDPDTGEPLGSEETRVGRVKVTRVGPKISYVEPIGKLDIEDCKVGMLLRPVSATSLKKEALKKKETEKKNFERRF